MKYVSIEEQQENDDGGEKNAHILNPEMIRVSVIEKDHLLEIITLPFNYYIFVCLSSILRPIHEKNVQFIIPATITLIIITI